MKRLKLKNKHLNIVAISFLAFFSAQVIHELMHLVSAILIGFEVQGFHLFGVNVNFPGNSIGKWGIVVVEAVASIVNILILLIAIKFFYQFNSGYLKLSAMMIAGFHGMLGFGYLLFDGLFYTPGAVGDWKTVLGLVDGALSLRISIIVIGALGYLALFFWLGKAPLVFLSSVNRNDSDKRAKMGLDVLIIPYILAVLFNVPLAFWHPLGYHDGFWVIFFQYVFGYSGFVTGFFMLWTWLAPKPFLSTTEVVLAGERKVVLWFVAVLAVIVQLFLALGI